MESEKVKEIKKTVRYFADKYMTAQCIGVPKRELFADILTIINELETENERLMKLQARGGCRVAELAIENQQLKDRIAELESENERLENKNYQLEQDLGQCENGYKLELHTARYQLHSANEDLKKAEKRIAELEEDKEKWQRKAVNYYQMAKSYGIECIIDNDIDELLKEYEK